MTSRERFHAIMNFDVPDRLPLWDLEGFTEGALRTWVAQGFPAQMSPFDYFGIERSERIGLDTDPIPSFVPRVIAEDDEWTTSIDAYGFRVRTLKEKSVSPTIYYYEAGSVNSREDWEQMKARYDPHHPRRYPKAWSPELLDHYSRAEHPIWARPSWGPGRGSKNGYMMGLERFLEILTDDPAFTADVFGFWADFLIELLRPTVEAAQIDYVFLMEDGLAYKNSTLVSPAMYRKFWMPGMKRLCDFLHSHGVKYVGHYTSGNIKPLIPVFLEIGMNLFAPLEVAADMDAIELRKEYGRDVLLMGNISRQALMDGPEAVEKEFYAKVPWLMEQGGYIPAVDDMILPDISFAAYSRYVELIREFRVS